MLEPIETLKHEHRVIERVLRALDGVCQRLESGGTVSPETLLSFPDFMRAFADRCHHGKEEVHLFPTLEQHGVPGEGGPIDVMLYEHEVGRGLVAELDRSAQACKDAAPEASQRFVDTARRYIDLLTQHIQKEDHVLFRIAEEVLNEDALASLGQKFEQAEVELGAGIHEQYERIAAELEIVWAP
ncbi:MAG: hemerythrin domain-containing protein [Acidobacteria bacterium]|nr:hemerythrin domain-containing protein [Acidobacteriota bacterium]